ncbi:MAG: cation:proton antiporter [Candidatus Aminicenantes bacterium]|jgi:Kef-type K+ transport system membrane component KefB
MSESAATFPLLILLLGVLIVITILIRSGLKKMGLPSLVGFMALGLLIKLVDVQTEFFSGDVITIFEFLADLGIIVLLFRVGLESNLKGLLNQIRHASIIWVGNIVFSGILGFVVAQSLLGLGLIPSLFIGVALTATSVGVSISVWQEEGKIKTKTGELLLDVAEMDDISGVILMALLLSVAPVLKGGVSPSPGDIFSKTVGILFLKLILFGILCFLFSQYVEKPITNFFGKLKKSPDPLLMVTGFGIIIAAIAGLLGFSLAMGAFFAGLVFSRDPKAVKLDSSFGVLYDFLVPFFFIGIGLNVGLKGLNSVLGLGAILFVIAVVGKLIGNGVFSLKITGWMSATLISVSMVPRAEIAMVIMQRGHQLGNWAVSDEVFSAMVLVSLGTCVFSPVVLRFFLKRFARMKKQEKNSNSK